VSEKPFILELYTVHAIAMSTIELQIHNQV